MNTKKTKRVIQMLAVGLTAFCGAQQARATLYTIGDGGLQGNWSLTIDGYTEGGNAGGIVLNPVGGGSSILTVCTDVRGTVTLGSPQYNYILQSYSAPNVDGLNPNWGAGNLGTGAVAVPADSALAIQNAAFIFRQHSWVLTGGTLDDKAALQLAVWEALYDTSAAGGAYSFTGGRFSASNGGSGAAAIALSWLNTDLGNNGLTAHTQFSGNLLVPTLPDGHTFDINVQGMLVPVPEPTTVLAGMLLLLPFGASTLRFVRKFRTA